MNLPTGSAAERICDVPKVIYSLWLQGRANAPDLVKLNFDRWSAQNPGYQVRILDALSVERLLHGSNLRLDHVTPQALSDMVRARLLLQTGGIWVDASVFPMPPLDDCLPKMLTDSGFFAFERPGPDRPLSSWFLVSTPNNIVLRLWWREIARFWSTPRSRLIGIPEDPVASVSGAGAQADEFPYFWFHYLFQRLVETDARVADAWSRSVKMSADGPHRLQSLLAEQRHVPFEEIQEVARSAPMHKLDWRRRYPLDALDRL